MTTHSKTMLIAFTDEGAKVSKSFASWCKDNGINGQILLNAKISPKLNTPIEIKDQQLLKLEKSDRMIEAALSIMSGQQIELLIKQLKTKKNDTPN